MIDLLTAWLLFPAVLAAICFGIGLAVDRLCGGRLPLALLPGLGVASIIVLGGFTTLSADIAEVTTPACIGLAIAGFAFSPRWRTRTVSVAPLAAAAGVFAGYAAPIVLSGEATFAGYIKLDDTATWLAFTEQVMERGRDLSGLPPSTFERTLDVNLSESYPLGGFIPLGVGSRASGVEQAWAFQPFMALLAAFTALSLYALARPAISRRGLAAAAAFLAGCSALLFGYAMWGGVKEIEMALLLPTLVALAVVAVRELDSGRRGLRPLAVLQAVLPVAILAASVFAALGYLGGGWIAPLLLPAAVFVVLSAGVRRAAVALGAAAVVTVLLGIPVIAAGNSLTPTADSLEGDAELGNLAEPLNLAQVAGIWPAGDFRVDPVSGPLAALLIALALAAALLGVIHAVRRRLMGPVTYAAGGCLGLAIIIAKGSPWVDGKAMATISPAVLLLAGIGVAWVIEQRRGRVALAAAGVGMLLVAGVAWSNLLAYRDVSLAPRGQLEELNEIGEEIAGDGPTLMTEYHPYGARYFLREAAPEGAAELRYRLVPLRDGGEVAKGGYADTDELDLSGLVVYRTLVLRRSPAQSRPPVGYEMVREGGFYTVWQRPPGPPARAIEHLPLGDAVDPGAVPPCSEVRRLAALLGPTGVLAAVPRAPVGAVDLGSFATPADWRVAGDEVYLYPETDGIARGVLETPAGGELLAWVGGSLRGTLTLAVDAQIAGAAGPHLNNFGQYVQVGGVDLGRGQHAVALGFEENPVAPGGGGNAAAVGPLILARDDIDSPVRYFPAARAEELCGKRWDWVEAIG